MNPKQNWQKTKWILAWVISITIIGITTFAAGSFMFSRNEFLLFLIVVCSGSLLMAGVSEFLRKKWMKSEMPPDDEETES